jgi:hypothetical protein
MARDDGCRAAVCGDGAADFLLAGNHRSGIQAAVAETGLRRAVFWAAARAADSMFSHDIMPFSIPNNGIKALNGIFPRTKRKTFLDQRMGTRLSR